MYLGVYASPRPIRTVRLVRVVKQWCTSRTVCRSCISLEGLRLIYKSTTRTSRTSRETMVYQPYSLSELHIILTLSEEHVYTVCSALEVSLSRFENEAYSLFCALGNIQRCWVLML